MGLVHVDGVTYGHFAGPADESGSSYVHMLIHNGDVVASVATQTHRTSPIHKTIEDLLVAQTHRGRGVATALLTEVTGEYLDMNPDAFIEFREPTEAGMGVWRSLENDAQIDSSRWTVTPAQKAPTPTVIEEWNGTPAAALVPNWNRARTVDLIAERQVIREAEQAVGGARGATPTDSILPEL